MADATTTTSTSDDEPIHILPTQDRGVEPEILDVTDDTAPSPDGDTEEPSR